MLEGAEMCFVKLLEVILLFYPTYFTEKVTDINVSFLKHIGIKGVVLDIDNTLVAYQASHADTEVVNWINELKSNDIKIILLSNNTEARVKSFAESLDLPYISMSMKPLTKNLKKAISIISCKPQNVLLIGDQVFTDILSANFMKIRSILVTPIEDNGKSMIKFRRILEKPIRKKLYLDSKINLNYVLKNTDFNDKRKDNNK